MTDQKIPDGAPKEPCRSLLSDRSTWHKYEFARPVDRTKPYSDYVERCVKCGHERTIEVEL